MDYAHRDWGRTFLTSLQNRVRVLSSGLAKRYGLARPKESLARKLKATVLLVVALTFGIAAHRLNDREAELRWKKAHLPSAKIWSSSFRAEGFRALANPSWVARVSRTLPTLSDSAGRVWKASPDWWAVETADMTAPLIYCLSCESKKGPQTWMSPGSGWEGWEEAMSEAHQQAEEAAKRLRRPHIPAEKIDPREIRY